MTIVAVLSSAIGWVRNLYYVQLNAVNSVLAEYPEIDRVWLVTNDDVELEVEVVYFSLVDQTGLTFTFHGIDGASKSEIRKRLQQALREMHPVKRPSYATEYKR